VIKCEKGARHIFSACRRFPGSDLCKRGRKGNGPLFRCKADAAYVRSHSCREFPPLGRVPNVQVVQPLTNYCGPFQTFHRCTPFHSFQRLAESRNAKFVLSGSLGTWVRRRYLQWVFDAKKRFGLSVINYIVASNHVHLLAKDTGSEVIAQSMQLIAGRRAGI
jgi:hypothetical protein